MSSAGRTTSSVVQGNAFFINIATLVTSDLLKADGTTATIAGRAGWQTGAAGTVVLRDMGKTVRIPGNGQSGTVQRVLRKVQYVDNFAMSALTAGVPTNGFINYNEGVGGGVADAGLTGFQSFYIEITPISSGTGVPKFARLSL
jgi:hypothetical protein